MPSRSYARWTAQERRLLREVLAEGASTAEAAEELGRSYRATQWMATRLKIERRIGSPVDPDKRSRILAMLTEGFSLNRIARVLGKDNSVIVRTVQRMEKIGLVRRIGTVSRNVRYVPCNDRELRCATKDSMR